MKTLRGKHEEIDFQTNYIADLTKETNYMYNLDASAALHAWIKYKKEEDITTYRSQSHSSIFTGKKSPVPQIPFMQEFDDSLEHFLDLGQ